MWSFAQDSTKLTGLHRAGKPRALSRRRALKYGHNILLIGLDVRVCFPLNGGEHGLSQRLVILEYWAPSVGLPENVIPSADWNEADRSSMPTTFQIHRTDGSFA